jgi:hypothetical protein
MEITFKINGKWFFVFGIIILVLGGILFVNAQIIGTPNPGHDAVSVLVNIAGTSYNLQDAVTMKLIGMWDKSGSNIYTFDNVGIGTSSPNSDLDVFGSLQVSNTESSPPNIISGLKLWTPSDLGGSNVELYMAVTRSGVNNCIQACQNLPLGVSRPGAVCLASFSSTTGSGSCSSGAGVCLCADSV